MSNTVDLPVAERDIKPPNTELALVRASYFTQLSDLAKCLDAVDAIATHLAKSTILPKDMQSPANLKLVLMQGMELGFTPLQAIRASFVITSKEGTKVGYYVDSLVALVRRSKVCRFFRVDETSAEKCRVTCARTDEDEGVIHAFDLTMAQALAAGLDKKNEWNPDTRQLVQKQKYVWKSAPADMLRARCQGRAVKSVFQDVVFGMYTGEEHEDLAAADALERVPEFSPVPTTPQPRREQWADHPKVMHDRVAGTLKTDDIVDADIVEDAPRPVEPPYVEADIVAREEGTGDPAWDGFLATLRTFTQIDTRGWLPDDLLGEWRKRLDAVRSKVDLKALAPWIGELSKGAAASKACADCAAQMKVGYNTADAALRKTEAKPS